MKVRSRGKSKALAFLTAGVLVFSGPSCLPKDFLYTYGSQAGISLIEALSSNLVVTIVDAIIPLPDSAE